MLSRLVRKNWICYSPWRETDCDACECRRCVCSRCALDYRVHKKLYRITPPCFKFNRFSRRPKTKGNQKVAKVKKSQRSKRKKHTEIESNRSIHENRTKSGEMQQKTACPNLKSIRKRKASSESERVYQHSSNSVTRDKCLDWASSYSAFPKISIAQSVGDVIKSSPISSPTLLRCTPNSIVKRGRQLMSGKI